MKTLLLIGCGSFAGGVLRYGVSRLLQGSQWLSLPLGTFCVNILGCLLLGICYGLLEHYRVLSEEIRLLFIVGFCGSFTTFSAFIHENLLLLRQSDLAGSALYVSLSVASGLLAVRAGILIGYPEKVTIFARIEFPAGAAVLLRSRRRIFRTLRAGQPACLTGRLQAAALRPY